MRWRQQAVERVVPTSNQLIQQEQKFARGTQELEPITDEDALAIVRREHERLLEEDIADIVHDLKSPLSAIALETMLLDDKIARGDRNGGMKSVDRINRNIVFLDRLVLDLLDVCALSTGHLRLHREQVELRGLLERVIERLVTGAERSRVFLDAAHAVTLSIDAVRIERVVANLLDNALKYAPLGSGIVIRVSAYAESACVSIIDAGPGLDELDQKYVFDRYRRAATSHGRTGSGLGLYVSKKIVEAHGGQIGVESVRGAGSRFFFELPATSVRASS
jgi:signal transduction histidine kinase